MSEATRHVGKLMVNGALLHYERRGSGPALVFIPGGLADSAHYAEVAQLLAGRRSTNF
jgi:pimeloyl-ACP methyl ester carboxylesterase